MWPFRHYEPEVTNDVYARWLRAMCPPLPWFAGLSDLEQEQLAILGDERTQDVAVAIGYTVRDPEVAGAGVAAARGDIEGEETLARRLAMGVVEQILARDRARKVDPPVSQAATMAGMSQRRARHDAAAKQKAATGKVLFGRQADEATA